MRSEFHAMGTRVRLFSDLGDHPGDEAFEQKIRSLHHLARGWFLQWEGTFSRFRPDSELSRLNQQQKAWVVLSPPFWGLLQAVLDGAVMTNGLVNPAMLPALETAGYTKPFGENINKASNQDETLTSTTLSREVLPDGWSRIRMDAETRSVQLPMGVRLDLGGYAKGWAADTAARLLGEYCPCLVDAGGDIAVSAPRADGTPWRIGIAHPLQTGQEFCVLEVNAHDSSPAFGVATSSSVVHRWRNGKEWNHHLIDPRSGKPAVSDLLQVSVLAQSALLAEIATKAVFILGGEAGLSWLDSQADLAGFVVYDTGELAETNDRGPKNGE